MTKHLNLFLYGVRAEGTISSGGSMTIDHCVQTYRMVHYVVDGVQYKLRGPLNIRYSYDTPCKIIYNKKDPTDCIIPSFIYLYTSDTAVLSGFILIVFVAFYTSFWASPKQNREIEAGFECHDSIEN
ncbi:MAG TPA: hypothetical protein PLP69_09430 [Bacteroidales bacterium]|nr:hypothetical protein [Bacteroidales bacterium]